MRGYSLVEITMVVAVTGVLATLAFSGVSTAISKQAESDSLQALLADVQRERNAHVSTGRGGVLVICADCVNNRGEAQAPRSANVVDFFVTDNLSDLTKGRVVFSERSAGLNIQLPGGPVVIDAVGRSVDASNPRRAAQGRLEAIGAGGTTHAIDFKLDGKLISTFAPPVSPVPAHGRNLSSRTTSDPMPLGRFEGDPSRAAAMPFH